MAARKSVQNDIADASLPSKRNLHNTYCVYIESMHRNCIKLENGGHYQWQGDLSNEGCRTPAGTSKAWNEQEWKKIRSG